MNVHNNICPKAPEVLFDSRSTYFNGIDDDQQKPLSARVSSANITRQLSNMSLNQSVYKHSSISETEWLMKSNSDSNFLNSSPRNCKFFLETIVCGKWSISYSISSN